MPSSAVEVTLVCGRQGCAARLFGGGGLDSLTERTCFRRHDRLSKGDTDALVNDVLSCCSSFERRCRRKARGLKVASACWKAEEAERRKLAGIYFCPEAGGALKLSGRNGRGDVCQTHMTV